MFVSERIIPDRAAFDTALMTQGLAALPAAFTWRGVRYRIVECLEHIKVTSNEGASAVGDRYLRRQQFTVRLDSGQTAVLYVERHAPAGASPARRRQRWYLYTIDD